MQFIKSRFVTYKLPVRPRPIAGEAAYGYLIRVTQSNGYSTPGLLHKIFNTVDEFSKALCLSTKERTLLFGPLPKKWGNYPLSNGLLVSNFNNQWMRWCPLCMREAAYIRGEWLLKFICVCTKHVIYLHETCLSCGSRQRLERSIIGCCNYCGARLTQTNFDSRPVEPYVLKLSQLLQTKITHNNLPPPVMQMTPSGLTKLIFYLGQFTETYQPVKPGKVANTYQLNTAVELMRGLAMLLDDWPVNFHRVLAAIHKKSLPSTSIRSQFGSIYRVLYFDLKDDDYQFLRDAFEKYLHENWWGIICRRNRLFKSETVTNHPQLTLKETASETGIGARVIKHLIQAELIPNAKIELRSGRNLHSVNKHFVSQIITLTENVLTLAQAANYLDLPKHRVRELIDAKIITPPISRCQTNMASWLIPMQQLQMLMFQPTLIGPDISPVALKEILQYWKLHDGEFTAFVTGLLHKEISPIAEVIVPTVLGKLTFDARQVQNFLDKHRVKVERNVCIDMASKLLGLKQQVVYELVKKGYIAAIETKRGRRVSLLSLQCFKRDYVSLAELATMQMKSSRKLLTEIGARPISGPSINNTRQYFYRKVDIFG